MQEEPSNIRIDIEVDIVSAHRTPKKLFDFSQTHISRNFSGNCRCWRSSYLPGMANVTVIGVPVNQATSIDGWDSILSISAGRVPVATVALNGAKMQ
jgi:5-(carboxyamino)imidazole ribonucleotide mutase